MLPFRRSVDSAVAACRADRSEWLRDQRSEDTAQVALCGRRLGSGPCARGTSCLASPVTFEPLLSRLLAAPAIPPGPPHSATPRLVPLPRDRLYCPPAPCQASTYTPNCRRPISWALPSPTALTLGRGHACLPHSTLIPQFRAHGRPTGGQYKLWAERLAERTARAGAQAAPVGQTS